ncbi:hypothetical protein FWK50_03820 [Histophilus somni]|nr:hypothetical protein FWK46_03830 [Histophilus somni]QEH15948.1 hypothetical protein FWK50_03820 [Histophilus somni]TFI34438.1 hypothetical protein E4M08_01740 [Histophilus somni]THA43391.1 hypothetical protein E5428_01750 [Histophilus somni]THA45378.1 hypothetical protein E5429_02655 [Histophilus somni]
MENLYQDVANIPFEQVIDRYLNEVTSQKSRSRVFRNNHIIIEYFYRYFFIHLNYSTFQKIVYKRKPVFTGFLFISLEC